MYSAVSTLAWATQPNYWSFQEYLKAYPQQQSLLESFSKRVREPAKPWGLTTKKKIQVGMIVPDLQVSDYWLRNKQSLILRLQEIGLPFQLISYSSLPSTSYREQERQLAEALNSDLDYLILTLNSLRHRVLIDKVITRNSPKLILMNVTTPLKNTGNQQPFFYVGFDHREGTRLLTDAINHMLDKKSNYLMLYGTHGYISESRGDEFIKLTADQPGFVMRQAFYTDVNRDKSKLAVKYTLEKNPNIDLIYACTTDIALGAMDALKELKRDQHITLNGWGGGSAELEAIVNGQLDLTVMRMNDDNGVAIAEAIRLDQENKAELIPQVYSGDFVIVDKHISTEKLERLKDYAFRYSKP
ncbi:substrate-binding domain-containing protein [Oceanisphaera sp. DM8]|uniref:Substrate-binding domain-containing protein n=2 Tax=Oceanisphaera pacifica TaxID=2818389 RepID=A0ABS3NI53_9GAMM|nr:substrate-binding domain-containing protein [Oceanisphaera pacifica]